MSNPLAVIPPTVRTVGYFVYGVGSLIATYLAARELIGADEIALWTGLGVLFGFTALSNVPSYVDVVEGDAEPPVEYGEHGATDLALVIAVTALIVAVLALFGVRA